MEFLLKIGLTVGFAILSFGAIFFGNKYLSPRAEQIIENTIEDVVSAETGIAINANPSSNNDIDSAISKEASKFIVNGINMIEGK